jgi:hypothetical protein
MTSIECPEHSATPTDGPNTFAFEFVVHLLRDEDEVAVKDPIWSDDIAGLILSWYKERALDLQEQQFPHLSLQYLKGRTYRASFTIPTHTYKYYDPKLEALSIADPDEDGNYPFHYNNNTYLVHGHIKRVI